MKKSKTSKRGPRHKKQRPRLDDAESTIDPVYHALSRINGDINKMTKSQLQYQLQILGLKEDGVKEVLMKRLKTYFKREKLKCAHKLSEEKEQYYPYLVVIDYEATCEKNNPHDFLHEIIEFPAVLISTENNEIVDEFHSYCKPILNPILSSFCTELTGITQSQVMSAPEFPDVLDMFLEWMSKHELLAARKCAFITDGSWDFSRFLNIQCHLSEIQYPRWARKWINLKKVFGNFYRLQKPSITSMLQNIGLTFEGRLHCGMDDTRNIAYVVMRMIDDGAKFQVNERLNAGKVMSLTENEKILLSGFEHLPRDTVQINNNIDKENVSVEFENLQINDDLDDV